MDNDSFGIFFEKGSENVIKSKADDEKNAPWISQLKSPFVAADKIVKVYATKDNSFNDMGIEIEQFARIYFVVDKGNYRIFGLAKGIGEKGRATFSIDRIKKIIETKPGAAFEININVNPNEIQPFIDLVNANGSASQDVMNRFIDLANKLLNKLGIKDRISKLE